MIGVELVVAKSWVEAAGEGDWIRKSTEAGWYARARAYQAELGLRWGSVTNPPGVP